jgi:hypothetical protein
MKRMSSVALLLVGCAPGVTSPASAPFPPPNAQPEHYTKLNESPRPMKARAPETVTIYRTKVPDAPYVEVSELVDSGDDEAEALDKLELSAAGVGCDGLIIGGVLPERTSMMFGHAHVTAVESSGTCIMFAQDPGTWRPSKLDARCAADRDRLFAAKDPEERAAIARSMPPDCHR